MVYKPFYPKHVEEMTACHMGFPLIKILNNKLILFILKCRYNGTYICGDIF